MKLASIYHRVGCLAATAGITLFLGVNQAWAQVQNYPTDEPKTTPGNGPLITWAIAIVISLGILGISFKTSKRTHRLDD